MATFNFYDILLSGRTVIGETLNEIGQKDERLYVVTADIGGSLKKFRANCPSRYIDVGIAEQAAAGVAAGLALAGNIPVVMGMVPFTTMRACEQNRTAIAYQDLPVRLIATGGGLTSGGGSTHNAMEDIAIMSSMVNMTVISIGDPNMIRDILYLGMDYPHPMYIRLAQGKKDHVIYEPGTMKYEIGKGIIAHDGKDITIIAHGEMVFQALKVAQKLEEEHISVRVVDMYSIKPMDEELVRKCIEETENIIVLEDHLMEGGLASRISDFMVDNHFYPKKFKRLGIPQIYAGFGSGEELRDKYGYGEKDTIAAVKELLDR